MTKQVYHTVYEIWNPFTLECIYVGKGNTKKGRKQDHLREVANLKAGKRVPNRLKAGAMAHIIDMGAQPMFLEVARYDTEEEALTEEMRLIVHYGRRNLGLGSLTNLNDGGSGNFGHVMPESAKRKIGEFFRGRKMPREAVERIRLANIGKKRTQEQIDKLRAINTGRKHSEEEKKIRADALRGKTWSEERRIAHVEHDPKKGRPWSEKTRKSMEEFYAIHGKNMPSWNDERRNKFQETHQRKQKLREQEYAAYDKKHRTKNMKPYETLTDTQKKNRNEYWAKLARTKMESL